MTDDGTKVYAGQNIFTVSPTVGTPGSLDITTEDNTPIAPPGTGTGLRIASATVVFADATTFANLILAQVASAP